MNCVESENPTCATKSCVTVHNRKMTNFKDDLIKIVYFTSLAGTSILLGFGLTLGKLKKNASTTTTLHDEGAALARKALLRGTMYSVGGFGLFSVVCYQLFGKKLIESTKKK